MKNILNKVLADIKKFIETLQDEAYSKPLECLSMSSIGEHTRHCLEMISELFDHCHEGTICYDNRKRDQLLQSSVYVAKEKIDHLMQFEFDEKLDLVLIQNFQDEIHHIGTNGRREIAYHIEHCIHHQAIIKIGAIELKKPVTDPNFGVAFSTLENLKKQFNKN